MKKKLFTLALCTIMAVVMAVPAFAAVTPRINLYQAYNLSPAFNTGLSIDIPFSNTNMAPILSEKGLDKPNQRWTPGRDGTTLKLYASMTIGTAQQKVMCYIPTREIVELRVEGAGSHPKYSQVEFFTVSGGYYRIQLPNIGSYLKAASPWNGSGLTVGTYNEFDNTQKWYAQ
ncbi:hypothetical protein DW194_14420 [Subdoligranulum sp. AM16-9]|nr:hypothetical protein DW194_14420 [Subdoligranulum sp. AM16-9]